MTERQQTRVIGHGQRGVMWCGFESALQAFESFWGLDTRGYTPGYNITALQAETRAGRMNLRQGVGRRSPLRAADEAPRVP